MSERSPELLPVDPFSGIRIEQDKAYQGYFARLGGEVLEVYPRLINDSDVTKTPEIVGNLNLEPDTESSN